MTPTEKFTRIRHQHPADMLSSVPGGLTTSRLQNLLSVIAQLTDDELGRLTVTVTPDERTGKRFGEAACRKGRCAKLGSGGRNPGQKGYQVWAVWTVHN